MEWLLAALVGGFLGFNALATPDRAANTLEATLRKTYPRATVKAIVEGKKGRSVLKGNFRRVRLEMSGIGDVDKLPFETSAATKVGYLGRLELALSDFRFGGLPVQNSEFTFDKVAYDFNALRHDSKLNIVQCGPASAKLTLGAAALQNSFGDSLEGVTNVKIEMHNGLLHMDAKKTLPLIKIGVPFHLTAKPVVQNDNEIWLTDGKLSFENTTGLSLKVKNLLADLNPIYTFDPEKKWPFRIRLTNVVAQNDQLLVNAELAFAAAPQVAAVSRDSDANSLLPALSQWPQEPVGRIVVDSRPAHRVSCCEIAQKSVN